MSLTGLTPQTGLVLSETVNPKEWQVMWSDLSFEILTCLFCLCRTDCRRTGMDKQGSRRHSAGWVTMDCQWEESPQVLRIGL